jgi:hypothetical protein
MSRPEHQAPPELYYDDKYVFNIFGYRIASILYRFDPFSSIHFFLRFRSDLFFPYREATKYSRNTRVIDIQRIMAERCLELLNFGDESSHLILDIGCGSGLSGGKSTDKNSYPAADTEKTQRTAGIDNSS